MRIWSLVFVFGLGCSGGAKRPVDAAPPVVAASPKLCGGGGAPLFLPAVAPSYELKLEESAGKLMVDGVVTASTWPGISPQQYGLPDGRTLLDDRYDANLLMLWDPRTRTLTELARGTLMPLDGRGLIVATGDETTSAFADLDPDAPRLRELYRFDPADERTQPAGVIDGVPVLMAHTAEGSHTMLCLSAAGVTTRFAVNVPAGFSSVGVDPIDGHRMLLLEDVDMEELWKSHGEPPFHAAVAILDLVTGTQRSLGRVDGAWTIATNMPHPVLSVGWNDGTHDTSVQRFTMPDSMIYVVDPKTETLGVARR